MTQPDGEIPDSAIASLSSFAAKTQEDWDDEIRGKTTNPYTKFVSGWAGLLAGITGAANNAVNAITQIGTLIWKVGGNLIDDVGDFINSALSNASTAFANAASALGNVQETINSIVRGFTGLFGDWGFGDVETAAEAVARQQAETAASVAKLQQLNSANAQGGNSGFVDFTGLADAATMGSSFDQYYSGAGTDTLGVVGGRVTVTPGVWDAGRVCRFVYTSKATLTDSQRVSVVLATSPGKRRFGPFLSMSSYAYNFIRARVAESGTYAGIDCVQVVFDLDSFDLGCVVNGVWTKWVTVSHQFRPGAIYSLDAGSVGGSRQYRILLNGGQVYIHNEVGTTSQLGSGFRRTGGGAEWVLGSDGLGNSFPTTPGALAAFYMADNTPPEMLSSVGRAFRASTAWVTFSSVSTNYSFPSGFFDTFDYSTTDMAWSGSAGTWTVSRRGNYVVCAAVAAENGDDWGTLRLRVNGTIVALGNDGLVAGITYVLPLSPGDVVDLLYTTLASNVRVSGGPGGDYAYFQISRITPDNLEDISA